MSHESYLIYVPGASGQPAEVLQSVGLGSLCGDKDPDQFPALHGPDGGAGAIYVWRDEVNLPANPDPAGDIEWTPCKPDPNNDLKSARFYMGRTRGCVIAPLALSRKMQRRGLPVTLPDGFEWSVPVAKSLLHVHSLDCEGNWSRKISSEYEDFCERSQQVFMEILKIPSGSIDSGETDVVKTATMSIPDADAYCVDALAINYRVNGDIVDWLGLLTDITMFSIMGATVELSVFGEIESQKKTGRASIPAG